MSHAAVCLVQPIFTFYNIMGVWLKYIQLGWSCYFVVSITTQLTKFVGLVVYLFVQWRVTWFSTLATAVLLLFHGTLSFWQLGDLDCYVQVLEPASLFSVSILSCLYNFDDAIHFCQLLKLWHSLVTRTFYRCPNRKYIPTIVFSTFFFFFFWKVHSYMTSCMSGVVQ